MPLKTVTFEFAKHYTYKYLAPFGKEKVFYLLVRHGPEIFLKRGKNRNVRNAQTNE